MRTVSLACVHVAMKAGRVTKCFALLFLIIPEWPATKAAPGEAQTSDFSASMWGSPEEAEHSTVRSQTRSCHRSLVPETG